MRIRHLLLSSVVFGGIAVMSASSFAQTAPAVVYKPQGEWAVTRVAAKGPGKDPYCTMARRFGDNTILTFARNGKDETSLAMDFQPNTLAKGQSYYVTLSAGADEKRAFDVTPVSDKAMVIRLGQDAKFHDALNRAGSLNVDVAGLQFKFELPDMEKGHQDLGGCVTSIVEPAAGEPTTQQAASAPVPAVTPEAIISAPAKAASVGNPAPTLSEAESLREENMRLKNALERERREYEDRFMKESAGSSQVSEVMEKLKLLEKENSDLKYQLADARSMQPKSKAEAPAVVAAPAVCAPTVSGEKDPAVQAELSLLREENTRLKADLAAQKTAMVELEMKASQAAEAAQGDSKKWATDTATISRLQSRVDELSAQNTKLQSDLTAAQASASASAAASVKDDGSITLSQLRSVEAQLRSVENERDTLRLQIDKMGEGGEDKLLKLSGSDWNLEQATRRYNEAEREIRRLGTQLEQARTKCTAEKKEIEYMLFDPEIATKEQISKLMTLEQELTTAKAELARKDTDAGGKLDEYQQKIASLEGELQTAKQGTVDAETLKAQITQAQADKKQLEQRVAQLEQGSVGGSASVNENLALKDRIAILEGEKSALEQKLASSIHPAAGTPTAPIQQQVVAAVSTQSPVVESVAPVPAEHVASADARMPGSVSTEPLDNDVYGGPVALSPKSVTPSSGFVSTQQAVVAAVPSAAPAVSLITADALAGQLRQAGLNLTSGIKKIEKASGPSSVAYSWDMGGLFGSAEQAPMQNPEQFKTLISKYLDKTKSRCAGDFAASPVPVEKSGSVLIESYEIACIGADGNGATAALAFYGRNGVFTTVAHEASMDSMDLAMDARDRVIASVSGATVKSN
jgi:hypothetical protein